MIDLDDYERLTQQRRPSIAYIMPEDNYYAWRKYVNTGRRNSFDDSWIKEDRISGQIYMLNDFCYWFNNGMNSMAYERLYARRKSCKIARKEVMLYVRSEM